MLFRFRMKRYNLCLKKATKALSVLTAELGTLKAELEGARKEVRQQKAAAATAEKARAAEKAVGEKHQDRVLEVEETLKGVFEARDKLQEEGRRTKEELEKL